MITDYFTAFHTDIRGIELPDQFPFPFTYEPHELCRIAVQELQERLVCNAEWNKLFGLKNEQTAIGKMFGVLVVQKEDGTLGYLSGFSGAIDGCNTFSGFVPPVYDLLNPQGFFKLGEQELSEINSTINRLENSQDLKTAQEVLEEAKGKQEQIQTEWKSRLKVCKKVRKQERLVAQENLNGEALATRLEELNRESQLEKIAFKKAIIEHNNNVELLQKQVQDLLQPIETLKQERKQKSARLQRDIFSQFKLLNLNNEVKSVSAIFKEQGEEVPPAGAGDCAGPKLLQYSFQQNLKPIALAEFWWGVSPKSEIRKHKQFYPPCGSKCAPIMKHMLLHMDVGEDPHITQYKAPEELEIIFEDEWLMVVNKPEQFLSVPGKEITDSVWQRVKQMCPEASGPLLVHRLDMATTGVLLIAKDSETHKALQSQFIKRSTRKRYIADLAGLVKEDSGTIDLPLRVDLNNRPQQLVCFDYGKSARTKWEVISRNNGTTRVYFYPVTGRTHQLRVHAAHPLGLNTPIVGDGLYGNVADRLHLHADFLEIIHPQTGDVVRFTSPVPF